MCRIAAFPPGFPKKPAIEILEAMLCRNTDGVGTAYLQGDQFMVNKYPGSLKAALSKGVPLLDHLPCKSWTIAHLRLATEGGNTIENTHPFIKGKYCIVHNGQYYDHDAVRLALTGFVKWKGQTDSEVAAYMIRKLGPQAFTKDVNKGGVYVALERTGKLHVMKTSGDLKFCAVDHDRGYLIASEMHRVWDKPSETFGYGYYRLGRDGFLDFKEPASWGSQSCKAKGYWGNECDDPKGRDTCGVPQQRTRSTEGGGRKERKAKSSGKGNGALFPPYQHELGNLERKSSTSKSQWKLIKHDIGLWTPDGAAD